MRRRTKIIHKKQNLSLFSENALILLISLVTLLLQLISFATTWNGAKIYLENVFPYAALCFAIAIQSVSYFFSNSMRTRASILKVIALFAALCCSTYYSYIGIYNSVNSPIIYLQENYTRIAQELTQTYNAQIEKTIATAQESVNEAASKIIAEYTLLTGESENIANCHNALADLSIEYTSNMRAPKQSAYENYEEYAAAYQAYINSISQSKNLETEAARTAALTAYGFTSIEALNAADQHNIASMNALQTALGLTDSATLSENITDITVSLSTAIRQTASGKPLNDIALTRLNRLFQAAGLCGYKYTNLSELTFALDLCAQVSTSAPLQDYGKLIASLPEGRVTDANTMTVKAAMDSEIMTALISLNSILPKNQQLSYTDETYFITDLYLIPIQALKSPDTRLTAFFSLAVAALIDGLSVLFAISVRKRKPLWKRHTLLLNQMEEYEPLIYATLPTLAKPSQALAEFLDCFTASPQTESDGYMLRTSMRSLSNYHSLAALLCQINLAKIVPMGFFDNEEETLLLKARFVFWASNMIYEEKAYE
ncbi:MAG: hypothetical protein IJX63_12825 [Lachnospiraceae bacterium]|nr:hypothetical protein [Lachnospiraceae bacterium]